MANQQFERTDRIASEIMRETEKIIREDVSDPRTDCMFSITHVDVTRDLRYAKVYVSVYDKSRSKEVLKGLKSAGGKARADDEGAQDGGGLYPPQSGAARAASLYAGADF